jgi:hypothetical protein
VGVSLRAMQCSRSRFDRRTFCCIPQFNGQVVLFVQVRGRKCALPEVKSLLPHLPNSSDIEAPAGPGPPGQGAGAPQDRGHDSRP